MTQPSNQPFFTIAIPTYNRARLLERSLGAALRQNFDNYEVVVGDNCSSDDTQAVVARFNDPRVRYFRHETNIGAIANFRFITEAARGEFLALNQDDDLLHPDYLRRCHAAVTSEPGIVAYACSLWRGSNTIGFTSIVAPDPSIDWMQCFIDNRAAVMDGADMVVVLLYIFHYVHPALVYRTSVFHEQGGFPNEVEAGAADLVVESRVFCQGRIAIDPWPGVIYYEHGGNCSHHMDKSAKRQCRTDLYHHLITLLESKGYDWRTRLQALLGEMNDEQITWVMRQWIRNRAPGVLLEQLWQALKRRNAENARRQWRLMASKIGLHKTSQFAARLLRSKITGE